jgi:acetyl-CoA synthetase
MWVDANARADAGHAARLAGEDLERRLEELLHQDRFPPPAGFLAGERVNDASLHAQAELDAEGFWAEQARGLAWDEPFSVVLDESNPPFYKWFTDGKSSRCSRARGLAHPTMSCSAGSRSRP